MNYYYEQRAQNYFFKYAHRLVRLFLDWFGSGLNFSS